MPRKRHDVKILPKHFRRVKAGTKTFEIRKNDRNYKSGDVIVLNEWDQKYTGRKISMIIGDIYTNEDLHVPMLQDGYCAFSLTNDYNIGG